MICFIGLALRTLMILRLIQNKNTMYALNEYGALKNTILYRLLGSPRKMNDAYFEREIEKLLKYELDELNRKDLKYIQDSLCCVFTQ